MLDQIANKNICETGKKSIQEIGSENESPILLKISADSMLSIIYVKGYGVDKDIEIGLKYCKFLSEQKINCDKKALADLQLYYIYSQCDGYKNPKLAIDYLKQAANQDSDQTRY